MTQRFSNQRRHFLRRASALGFSAASLAAINGKLPLISAAAAACPSAADYKALVCVFLFGGSDSFNLFVPRDQARYNQYARVRGNLAIARGSLVPANDGTQGEFGFHPSLSRLGNLYNQGKLAVISNVGTLVKPTSKDEYLESVASGDLSMLPQDLFAHDAQQNEWQTAARIADNREFGWGGGIASRLERCNGNSTLAPGFSIAGTNIWQTYGNSTYVRLSETGDLKPMLGYEQVSAGRIPDFAREDAVDRLNEILEASRTSSHLLEREAAATIGRSIESSRKLEQAVNANLINTPFNQNNHLAAQMEQVARLIKARGELGMTRQVFFVGLGGWDTHTSQNNRLPALLSDLDDALSSFYTAIDSELGVAESVTTFTASDFGRTLTSNGDGTDHGWGGHYFVMGDSVDGGRIHGRMPSYELGGPDDSKNPDRNPAGRIIPTLSVNQYGATLTKWMGVSDAELSTIFPDLNNFNQRDVGFMIS